MDDYIRRSAAVACCGEYLPGSKLIAKEIAQIPADEDVVKVVRCRECAHCISSGKRFFSYCGLFQKMIVTEGFYCASGERKDDNNG